MFYGDLTRTELLGRVQKIRKSKLCCYIGFSCDCKFGADLDHLGEQTGCPEVMVAQALIHNMTDEEFEAILARK